MLYRNRRYRLGSELSKLKAIPVDPSRTILIDLYGQRRPTGRRVQDNKKRHAININTSEYQTRRNITTTICERSQWQWPWSQFGIYDHDGFASEEASILLLYMS